MTESVWDYPRPPRVEQSPRRIRIVLGGVTVASSASTLRVLETSHPPVYYVPFAEVAPGALDPAGGATFCEYKGSASYFDVLGGGRRAARAAWTYRAPSAGFEALRGHVAFYPARMDECTVDGEVVAAQEGDFYGGWITGDIVGPFKGAPGTRGW